MTASWLDDYLRERMGEISNEKTEYTFPHVTVQKMTGYVQVPNELMADMGLIPWVWNKPYEPTRRERFRRWRSGLRDRVATWAYERISGDKFPGPYED